MASVNKVILLGNLGKDPESKTFENGGVICSFTLATADSYYDREKNQRIDLPTEWHNIRISRAGLAKVAQQYLKKGSQVYLEGSLRTRQYQTKEGETKYFTEINVSEMVLTGSKNPQGTEAQAQQQPGGLPPVNDAHVDTDDLPF